MAVPLLFICIENEEKMAVHEQTFCIQFLIVRLPSKVLSESQQSPRSFSPCNNVTGLGFPFHKSGEKRE